MLKTNYHTHCYLCGHAEGLPSDYIKKAIELGFSEIGISDHGPLLPSWTIPMNKDKMENIYFKDIDDAINKYGNKIKIYKALEMEYYPEYNDYYQELLTKVDYLILGQHALKLENSYFDIYKVTTIDLVYKYAEEVIEALNTGYFKILAHPELFIFRYPEVWNDEMDKISRRIIEAAIKNDVYLQSNNIYLENGTLIMVSSFIGTLFDQLRGFIIGIKDMSVNTNMYIEDLDILNNIDASLNTQRIYLRIMKNNSKSSGIVRRIFRCTNLQIKAETMYDT